MQPTNRHNFDSIERHTYGVDPIEAIQPGYDDTDRMEVIRRDIQWVDKILTGDRTISDRERTELYDMGINLRLDWLYSEHGGRSASLNEFLPVIKEAESFFKQAADHAYERHKQHPQDFWKVQTKILDLHAYEAHRFASDSQTTLKGTDRGQKLFGFSEDLMRGVVADSIRLMKDMGKHIQADTPLGQDARGAIYEQMLVTYARQQSYEAQNFDTVFVRSALRREDEPWNGHVYPKRGFDVVISAEDHLRLLQAKNHRNSDQYAHPIEKVADEHFGDTMDNMPRYLADFALLVDNPSDPHLTPHLNRARRDLDEVFGSQLLQAA
jgi:hypothetical protein